MGALEAFFVMLSVFMGTASIPPVDQTNSDLESTVKYNITTPRNYQQESENITSKQAVVFPEPRKDDNTVFNSIIYIAEANISTAIVDEIELPSVFDLSSYNNTCDRIPKKRICFIRQIDMAKTEAELCRKYANIVKLAYDYSCLWNVPGDKLINAARDYVQIIKVFEQTHRNMSDRYTQSLIDVTKMAYVVRAADEKAAQTVRTSSLPHSPTGSFQLVPNEIPVRYQQQEIYVSEVKNNLLNSYGLLKYIMVNNLTNVFPYYFEILLEIVNEAEVNFQYHIQTLETLRYLLQKYDEFQHAYRVFDAVVLGSAGVIFLIGIFLNGLLIAVFARYTDTRTYPNAMLINLVVVDYISLTFNLLIYYVVDRFFYSKVGCTVLTILIVIRDISYIVSIYSVVIISFQRYRAVQSSLSPSSGLSVKTKIILETCGVWVFGVLYSLPHMVFVNFSNGDCSYDDGKYSTFLLNFQFVMLCVLPVILVTIFSILTSQRLRRSIKALPGEKFILEARFKERTVSSHVILGMMVVCIISYLPHHIAYYVLQFSPHDQEISIERTPTASQYILALTYNILYINSCFNPLIIYFLSSKFRKYVHEIIFRCKQKKTINTQL